MVASSIRACSLSRGSLQNGVELILQAELLLLHRLDFFVRPVLEVHLDVLDPLVELVMAIEELQEVTVGRLKFSDEVAMFRKHGECLALSRKILDYGSSV